MNVLMFIPISVCVHTHLSSPWEYSHGPDIDNFFCFKFGSNIDFINKFEVATSSASFGNFQYDNHLLLKKTELDRLNK